MAKEEKKIFVYENWSEETPVFMGTLYANAARGAEVFSFEYDESFLRKGKRFTIDPELEFFSGRQYTYQKPNFGIFADSSPSSNEICFCTFTNISSSHSSKIMDCSPLLKLMK